MEMTRLYNAYGQKQNPERNYAYYEALQYAKPEELAFAVTRIIQDDPHFPKTPRIIEFMMMASKGEGARAEDCGYYVFVCPKCLRSIAIFKSQMVAKLTIPCDNTATSECNKAWNGEAVQRVMESHNYDRATFAVLP
jgi:hypothetical protein